MPGCEEVDRPQIFSVDRSGEAVPYGVGSSSVKSLRKRSELRNALFAKMRTATAGGASIQTEEGPVTLFRLDDETAVVTGAGSGIGAAIATLFAEQGAKVAILDRDLEAATATAEAITGTGGSTAAIECDVSDEKSVGAAFDRAESDLGPVTIVVNNAGVAAVGGVLDTTPEELERVYRVNVQGVFLGTREGVRRMKERGDRGAILNLASIASLFGVRDRFAYSMSKGAVLTMTYSTAIDHVDDGIRCNCICPARVHTPFVDGYLKEHYPGEEEAMFRKLSDYQPVGRMGTPEEVAAMAVYLCSDAASFITGAAFPLDGGVWNAR